MKTTKKFLSIILAILMIATSVPFAFAADCVHDNSGEHTCLGYYCGACDSYYGEPGPHMLVLDGDIKTPVTCSACDSTIYESDSRWTEGIYESIFEGAVAKFKGFSAGNTDEIVAYYVVNPSAGENFKLSFDWAINQDFTAYGGFKLHLYHNDNEVITHDFTQSANPHDSVLSEKYLYTADGEYQVFKFVFEKTNRGNWTDDGRKAFLSNIKNEIETECDKIGHEFVTYVKSAEASCGVNAKETAKCKNCEVTDTREIANTALEHIPLEAVKEKEVAPKCGVAGSYELAVYCDLCDDVLERETVTVAALEHKDDDGDYKCDYNCGFAFETESDGVKTILDVSKGYIVIADSYVTLGDETVSVDPDGYIITGTAKGDTPLRFINNSEESKTFDLVFNNLSLTANTWNSVIVIEDNSPVTLNIVCEGSNAISSDNHPVFNNTKAQTSITINITITEGSSFTFERRSYQESGILFSKDDTNTFVYINGNQLDAAAQCYVHKNIDGIQDCRGYLCDNCGQYFGEADADNHSFTKYKEVEAPKCGVAGKEVAVCDNGCDATDEKEIPALEHEFNTEDTASAKLTRPVKNADGTYTDGYYTFTCQNENCEETTTVTVKVADYTAFDIGVAEVEGLLETERLIYWAKTEYTKELDVIKALPVFCTFEQSSVDYNVRELGVIITELTEGIANGRMLKANFSEMEALFAEINELAGGDINNITPNNLHLYNSVKSYYDGCSNNNSYSQAYADSAMPGYISQLETLKAGLLDGTMLKADYTQINAVIAAIDEKLQSTDVSVEVKMELANIKTELDSMKLNPTLSQAAFNESGLLEKAEALNKTIGACADGNHEFVNYVKSADASCGVNAIETAKCENCEVTDTREIEGSALTHSFSKYEEVEAPKCGVAGKEVAVCDHGCDATDEKEILALEHIDEDSDYLCDHGCGHEFEIPVAPTPDEPTPDVPTDDTCDHICHSNSAFVQFFWKIIRFLQKLFGIQQYCDCGVVHW